MKSVRFAVSSDDSDDDQLRMNYDDSESEEEISKLFRVRGDSSSSDDEELEEEKTTTYEDKPQVLAVKAPYKKESVKRVDILKACMERIHNSTKIGDNNSIFLESKKLFEAYSRASKYFGDGIPKYFIRFLSMLESYINNQWTNKAKLSTKNRKSLTPLYGLMRPRFAEFRAEIDKYNSQNENNEVEDLFEGEETILEERKMRVESAEDEVTEGDCLAKMTEIVSVKFKQRNIHEQTFDQLEDLLEEAKSLGVGMEAKIVVSLLELVDLHVSDSGVIKDTLWTRFGRYFGLLLGLMEHVEVVSPLEGREESLAEGRPVVHCGLVLIVEHLCLEFRKRLLGVDEFSLEFVERYGEEDNIISTCQRVRDYLKGRTYCADVSILLLELLYYKYAHLHQPGLTALIEDYAQDVFGEEDSSSVLSMRAVLYLIYHHSLHLRWLRAYELFCYSHLPEVVGKMDAVTQSLYNRCLAQMGLCAFFLGRFEEAYKCLGDIAAHPQVGHLMGHEGENRVPLHMHVNTRLLEFAYLVSALLVQVPSKIMGTKKKKDLAFKHFENVLSTVEKTAIRGPPEDIWEHVVHAAHLLRDGDWRSCYHTLTESSSTSKLLSLVLDGDRLKRSLRERIKSECLRMFLWSFWDVYSSMSLDFLRDEFELELETVETLVGGMIVGGLVEAFVRDGFIVMIKKSKSSTLIMSLADKINEQISN